MIPEIGQLALVLGLCLALVQGVFPLVGAHLGRGDWMALARPAASGQFVFITLAFGALIYAFLTDDFSVSFVYLNSNTALPAFYKVTAAWGGHEGSILFWVFVLACWTFAVAAGSRSQPEEFSSRVLGVLGLVNAGIIAFTVFTSNPFTRLAPAPLDGQDLNPLLQDPGMIFHPPTLYIGYVGLSVPFAFAVAALLTGRLDREWARWTRPWTMVAWLVLTLGIAFGSWWAYYELGWGGWWFWDPVENASFMPWLMATALLHSLAVTQKRGIFKSWSVLLAIAGFSLSLLGTFLTRSDVIESVHSFAAEPTRGRFILMLFVFFCGGSMLLYALRAAKLEAEGGFRGVSRESFILANNVLLVVATGAILLGTLYPLFVEALGFVKPSVGPPFFDVAALVAFLPMSVLLGFGMHAAWKKASGNALVSKLRWAGIAAIVVGVIFPLAVYGSASILTIVGVAVGVWMIGASLVDPVKRYVLRNGPPLTRSHLGMCIAHLGVGVFAVGACVTNAYNLEIDRALRPGETLEAGGYQVVFKNVRETEGPNYIADEGEFELRNGDGEMLAVLTPENRTYRVRSQTTTEAAIDVRFGRDVFVALADPLGDNAWGVRVRIKPLISFVWFGAMLMALGGVVALGERRRRPVEQRMSAPAEPLPAEAS